MYAYWFGPTSAGRANDPGWLRRYVNKSTLTHWDRCSKVTQAKRARGHAGIGVVGERDGGEGQKTDVLQKFPVAQIRRSFQREGGEGCQAIEGGLVDLDFGDGCMIEEIGAHLAHAQDWRDGRRGSNIERKRQSVVPRLRLDLIRLLHVHESGHGADASWSYVEAGRRGLSGAQLRLKHVRRKPIVPRARAELESAQSQLAHGHGDGEDRKSVV